MLTGGIAAVVSPQQPSGAWVDALVLASLGLPVLAFALYATAAPDGQRRGWLLIGAGLAFSSAGNAYFYFEGTARTAFPMLGDALCLALYPLLLAGVGLLVQQGRDVKRISIGFDGVVIALAIGALAYELIFNALLSDAEVERHLLGGELVYSILDLIGLTMLAVISIPSRFRVGAAYLWLMAAMLVLLATDVTNLRESADGSPDPSTALYFGWGLALVLLSLSSRFDASLVRSDAFRGHYLNVALGGAILLSLALLLQEAGQDRNQVVIAVSGAALLLGLARLFHTLTENNELICEREEVIKRQREMQTQLRRLADHDSLTGLCNRRHFAERLDEQLRYARRYRHTGALLYIDLDSFKFINDSFGHPAGDRLLRRVAKTISDTVRATDTAARLGGDEFAVLLPEADEEAALRVAEAVLGAIKAGRDPIVGASAGVVVFDPDQRLSADDLMVAADIALYDAKQAGHGGVCVYRGQKGMKLTWVERIRAALREDRLVLYSQPIVDLRSGEVAREELLVRMIDRSGREIPPGSFLPTAERFGLIGDIDRFAVDRAIELAREGRNVAVNISGPALADRGLVDQVSAAIRGGMEASRLSFELTETASVANIEAARRFATRLEGMGCELALDDFGTGLSSLGYLRHIPIQALKIDTEFVRGMTSSTFDRYLVQTIVGLARRLGQKVVAEGVEDEAALSLIRMFGVDYAQGFLLGPPAPIDPAGPAPIPAPGRAALRAPDLVERLGEGS